MHNHTSGRRPPRGRTILTCLVLLLVGIPATAAEPARVAARTSVFGPVAEAERRAGEAIVPLRDIHRRSSIRSSEHSSDVEVGMSARSIVERRQRVTVLHIDAGLARAAGALPDDIAVEIPFANMLAVSDKPLHARPKLSADAQGFYTASRRQHVEIAIAVAEKVRQRYPGGLPAADLRSPDEPLLGVTGPEATPGTVETAPRSPG